MPEPTVVQATRDFKSRLLARERAQVEAMARRWLDVEAALNERIDRLADQIEQLRQAGEEVSRSRLAELQHYRDLLAQARVEMRRYERWSEELIRTGQASLGQQGIQDAAQAIQLSFTGTGTGEIAASFDILPVDAVETMVGFAGDGSPLNLLLRTAWPAAAQRLTDELVRAIALGRNPRDTARAMRQGLAGGLNRILTIARTEQLRAYREMSRQQYQKSGVVTAYRRIATRDSRTCMACLVADGTLYDLDQVFMDHPNGRCALIPVVKGLPPVQWQLGADWFQALPDDEQRAMMGAEYWDAWKAGRFALADIPRRVKNDTWGDSLQVRSLKDLLVEGSDAG